MKHLSYLLLAALFVLVSCQVKIPEGIILPDKMESVLYDYHMAQAIGSEMNVSYDYHKKLFHEYVFAKHGIDKPLFDSSLVWYTRHPSYLTQIYANLQEQFDYELAVMQDEKSYTQNSKFDEIDIYADTLNLWSNREVLDLSSSPMNNLLKFSYSSDSAFVAGDSIVLTVNTRFFGKEACAQKLYAAVVVNYEDNSSESKIMEIDASNKYTLQFTRDYDKVIEGVNGFIYYSDADSAAASGVLLSGISLRRIHPLAEEDEQ